MVATKDFTDTNVYRNEFQNTIRPTSQTWELMSRLQDILSQPLVLIVTKSRKATIFIVKAQLTIIGAKHLLASSGL